MARYPHRLILRKEGSLTPWPWGETRPVEFLTWSATMPRMGLWNISAETVVPESLDPFLSDDIYVELDGLKWVLDGSRSSEQSTGNAGMWKHTLRFVPQVHAILSRTLFYDCVSPSVTVADKPVSNSTSFKFYGDLREFARRLSSSMRYRGLRLSCVINANIQTEPAEVSFDNSTYMEALQAGFKAYGVPFWIDGSVIRFGWGDEPIARKFTYGADGGMLSLKGDTDTGGRVTLATGRGSDRNIPPYYPNSTPKGDLGTSVSGMGTSTVEIVNPLLYASRVGLGQILRASAPSDAIAGNMEYRFGYSGYPGEWAAVPLDGSMTSDTRIVFENIISRNELNLNAILFRMRVTIPRVGRYRTSIRVTASRALLRPDYYSAITGESDESISERIDSQKEGEYYSDEREYAQVGSYWLMFIIRITPSVNVSNVTITAAQPSVLGVGNIMLTDGIRWKNPEYWGLKMTGELPAGATITQTRVRWIPTADRLIPPRYRNSEGTERFYPAINNTYEKSDGEYYHFPNEYVQGNPREAVFDHEGIYPSITGMTNAAGVRMDAIAYDAIFDSKDSNAFASDEEGNVSSELEHPRFFVRLPIYDGAFGFNLFDQALEGQDMSLHFTSGPCAGCTFKVAVGRESDRNPVYVGSDGMPMRDDDGNVVLNGAVAQSGQDDTSAGSIWIALDKEDSTFGVVMPDYSAGLYPRSGDTFVILGINLPQSYILAAESRLEKAILEDMQLSNIDKLTLSGTHSRVILAQDPDTMAALSPDSRIKVDWQGVEHILYVTQMTVRRRPSDSLPDIALTFAPTLEERTGTMAQTVKNIVSDVIGANVLSGGGIDVLSRTDGRYLRRDVSDSALGRVSLLQGFDTGDFQQGASGAALNVSEDGSTRLEVDFIDVRRAARFNVLEAEETRALSGSVVLSSAGVKITAVEEVEDGWKCYFTPNGPDGVSSAARFVPDDLAMCSSGAIGEGHWYWRRVLRIGTDYIVLSSTDSAAGSDVPAAGDSLVQMGNLSDTTRQAALMVSATGVTAPEVTLYRGINSFSLANSDVTGLYVTPDAEGILYSFGQFYFGDRDINANNAQFITYQKDANTGRMVLALSGEMRIGSGSSGLSNLSEWSSKQNQIDKASGDASDALSQADNALSQAGEANSKADDANSKADNALSQSGDALSQAGEANNKATDANNKASDALTKAGDADTKAGNALTKAGEALTQASSAQDAAEYAQSVADSASAAANEASRQAASASSAAQTATETAQSAAASAASNKSKLDAWASDGVISPVEKTALVQQKADVTSEYSQIISDAARYEIDPVAYTASYDLAIAALNKYTANPDQDTAKESDYDNIAAYYTARQTILDAIAAAAKSLATEAAQQAQSAKIIAEGLESRVAGAETSASDALSRIEKINDDNVFTVSEKRALRETMMSISSVKGVIQDYSGRISRAYEASGLASSSGNVWTKVTEADYQQYVAVAGVPSDATGANTIDAVSVPTEYNGYTFVRVASTYYRWTENANLKRFANWYRSPDINDEGYAKVTLTFNMDIDGIVEVQFASDAETSFDYLVAARMDEPKQLTVESIAASASADIKVTPDVSTKGSQLTVFTRTYGLTAGAHTLQILFLKDYSTTTGLDSGFYRILTERPDNYNDGLFGSYHDTIRSGISGPTYQLLNAAAVALSENLTQDCLLWVNEDTDLSTMPDFRDVIQREMAEYYRVLEEARRETILSGVEYLKDALKDGATVISGGLVMAQMVAVTEMPNPGEGPEKVVAGINGSDVAKDAEHGKLMMFAGSESGLPADISQSETRVYEDGTLITKRLHAEGANVNGHIEADTGRIGGFDISEGALTGSNTNTATLSLAPGSALFTGNDSGATMKSSLGQGVLPAQFGVPTAMGASVVGTTLNDMLIAGYFSASGATSSTSASEGGNHALYIPKGDVCGFRPKIRVLTTGTTLSAMDCVVVVQNTSAATLTLPSGAENGQLYLILHAWTSSLTIQSSSSDIYMISNDNSSGGTRTSFSSSKIEGVIVVRGNGRWFAKWVL